MAQHTAILDRVDAAARRLYDAEIALHIAHTSHVDAWIAAASDRLHDAVEAHLAAVGLTSADR
jgi:hypothetical protein